MDLLDRLLSLDAGAVLEPPATLEQLALLREALGESTPPLLEALLAKTNGGEFSFLRFEPSPFLPHTRAALWDYVQSHYPPSDLIERREFLPLGNDYGDGLYCLNLRYSPARVTFVPYWARSEDEFSQAAPSFEEFLKGALSELERTTQLHRATVMVPLSDSTVVHTPELKALGVKLRFIDRTLVVAAERSSPFPNADLLALYEDDTRSLFYTLETLDQQPAPSEYGIVNSRIDLRVTGCRVLTDDGLEVSNGSGFQYLTEVAPPRRYPVWSLTLQSPLRRGSYLVLDFEHICELP